MKTPNLKHFVEQENRMAGIFGTKELSLSSAVDRQRIADMVDSSLSPENLSCDGELGPRQVQQKYKYLTAVARELLSVDPDVKMWGFVVA
jgi:hypothetical protein